MLQQFYQTKYLPQFRRRSRARARQSPAIITNAFDVQQSTVRGTAVYFHTPKRA
jgi:hypothetical protein